MTSLVEEIQREAIDEAVPVSTLLRKVKLAAFKLGLSEVESWVADELNGYNTELPTYRLLHGVVKYNNGYTGWQTLMGDTKNVSKKGTGQSISQIEAMLKSEKNAEYMLPFSAEICAMLDKACGGGMRSNYGLVVDGSQMAGVLAAVRDRVLDWAMNLERAGIRGDGMTFSNQEKQAAGSTHINIGNIGSMNGNLGVGNSIGTISVGDISVEAARAVVSQLKQNADALAAAAADGDEFLRRLEQLEQHFSTPATDPSFIKSALGDIRVALSGAAGNLIASGAVSLLNGVLGTGVPAA